MGPITDMVPGSVQGIHLVVDDIEASRAALVEPAIEASEVHDVSGDKHSCSTIPT